MNTITNCRLCGEASLAPVLDLGQQPLANSLKRSADEAESRYPLSISFCRECNLVQLDQTIEKEILFKNYVWVTGTSPATREYARVFFERVRARAGLAPGDLVLEIASNDGTFLRPFVDGGYPVIGVDPAENIAETANRAGIRTMASFWGRESAERVLRDYGRPKVVIARNVIPHVSELHEIVASIRDSLSDSSVGVIEFHDSATILDELHYDSIYHEHLCFFTLKTMTALLAKYGLEPFHVDPSRISGGSHVIYFARSGFAPAKTPQYLAATERERALAANELSAWQAFATRSAEHRKRSLELVGRYDGRTVVGFGASARSSTYLNYCGFSKRELAAIIDNAPAKQGRFTAGTSIPIVSSDEGLRLKPELLFLVAWNFAEELVADCRKKGYRGAFLVPFPREPHLIKGLD